MFWTQKHKQQWGGRAPVLLEVLRALRVCHRSNMGAGETQGENKENSSKDFSLSPPFRASQGKACGGNDPLENCYGIEAKQAAIIYSLIKLLTMLGFSRWACVLDRFLVACCRNTTQSCLLRNWDVLYLKKSGVLSSDMAESRGSSNVSSLSPVPCPPMFSHYIPLCTDFILKKAFLLCWKRWLCWLFQVLPPTVRMEEGKQEIIGEIYAKCACKAPERNLFQKLCVTYPILSALPCLVYTGSQAHPK